VADVAAPVDAAAFPFVVDAAADGVELDFWALLVTCPPPGSLTVG
jgi:hypothetical protein